MPYSTRMGARTTYATRTRRERLAATRTARRYGNANTGYPRAAVRRMNGPPAALYPRIPTNAMALKCVDKLTTGAVASTTSPQVLIVPLLGSAFFNRLSNRTRGVSLQLTGFIAPNGANTAVILAQMMRIVVYYDRQPNGANPAQSDVLLDTVAAGTNPAVNPESGVNINNRDRFMILRDRKVLLPELGVAAAAVGVNEITSCISDLGKGSMNYQEFIKLKGLESLYNSTNGGTVGDISAGAFGLLVFNADASSTPGWNFTLQARFKFLD